MIHIGILAVQGAFIEHQKILNRLGVNSFQIRKKSDLNQKMDGIILPGGESTTISKLLNDLDLFNPILTLIKNNFPVMGTCAGMILLAKNIVNQDISYFKTLDVVVERNAYGRQLSSFHVNDLFNEKIVPMTFIRAPYIKEVGKNVEILSIVNDKIVAVRQNNQLATSFHPELDDSTTIHEYFLDMIKHSQKCI
jgi:pyridoxal 5'-phosphate synthase pdxT subunit